MKIKPLRDRIVCRRLPVLNPATLVGPLGEQWSTTDSMTRLQVVAVGPNVTDIEAGSVCLMGKENLLRMLRTRKSDGEDLHLLHESDIDAVEAP